MKNLILIVVLAISSITVNAQYGVDNIFRKYKNDSGVMAWQFDGDISKMLNREDGVNIKSSIESVDFVLFTNEGDITEKDQDKLARKIQDENYELLVQARDKGQKIKIMGISNGDSIKKVFAQMKVQNMNAYFFLTGEIYLEDLQEIDYKSLMSGMEID